MSSIQNAFRRKPAWILLQHVVEWYRPALKAQTISPCKIYPTGPHHFHKKTSFGDAIDSCFNGGWKTQNSSHVTLFLSQFILCRNPTRFLKVSTWVLSHLKQVERHGEWGIGIPFSHFLFIWADTSAWEMILNHPHVLLHLPAYLL